MAARRGVLAVAWDDGYQAGHEDARSVQPTYPDQTPNPHRTPRRATPATWVPDAPTPAPRRAAGRCPDCGHALNGDHHCTHQED